MTVQPPILIALLLAGPAGASVAEPPAATLEPVLVTATLMPMPAAARPGGVTVLGAEDVREAAVVHLEELLPQLPSLSWAGASSRPRYFQLRGIGELEQYEGAPNPSVGFIVDDIDLSGIGGVATTFDMARAEILRGPQGSRYGANALAGLVYLQSADPVTAPLLEAGLTTGGDATRAAGVVASGAIPGAQGLAGRLAVQQYRADGFRDNAFLGRDDTNRRDELTLRGKLAWQVSPALRVRMTGMRLDADNGYDAFAIDNTFTTQSDAPGRDAQRTDAGALRIEADLGDRATLVSISGYATTDADFSFDADWGNAAYWAPFVYDFRQAFARQRETRSQELRLVSAPGGRLLGADWVTGVYLLDLDERIRQLDLGRCDAATCGEDITVDSTLDSRYDATSVALFGELHWPVGEATTLSAGLRREVRDADYRDALDDRAAGVTAGNRLDARDRMTGGELTLRHHLPASSSAWARIARGYRAGGFNPGLARFDFGAFPDFNVSANEIRFDDESLWSYEAGLRLSPATQRWSLDGSVFWMQREDLQVKIPIQLRAGDPLTFVFYTDNAQSGRSRGAELALSVAVSDRFRAGAAVGVLDTGISRFAAKPALEGRELAHAPRYTFAITGDFRGPRGWFGGARLGGRDRFLIDYCQSDDCRDPTTSAYALLDLRAGREWGQWQVEGWLRNALDRRYTVRGFFFGNEPPDFTGTLYRRLGDRRHAGVTLRYAF